MTGAARFAFVFAVPGRHDDAMGAVERAVLDTPGDLQPEVRRAVGARAATLARGAGPTDGDGVPDDLAPFLDKVAKHAYKVIDRDVERLLAAGYSEDAIFEATLAAALGAAWGRRAQALDALAGR